MYDVAIIGTGPAGISAALTLKLRNKNILFLGQESLSPKIQKAHLIQNYPGLPAISGEKLQKAFTEHLAQMEIGITSDSAKMIYAMGDYFSINGTKQSQPYQAKSLILATGVNAPQTIPGEKEFLGRGVSYCATCDGFFYKGKTIGVVAQGTESIEEIKYLAEIAQKVLLVADFAPDQHGFSLPKNVHLIEEKIEKIEGSLKAQKMVCTSSAFEIDGVFIFRQNVDLQVLVPGLACGDGFITVDKNMQTNIAGCFACGDCTGKPFQYAKAAGEGNIAAHSACTYLDAQKQALQQAKN